uniref:Uncharacterized protein n=1 Tax=Anguilla anguilla TaxID=7936 RepID=A0A0E9Q9A4_ANGAN
MVTRLREPAAVSVNKLNSWSFP